jgi:long-chain acyl-CoA synthetase
MLYDCWQKTVQAHAAEVALTELGSGRRWTFAQLDAEAFAASRETTSPGSTEAIYPTGTNAQFILATLAAWRQARVLCPLERGVSRPDLTGLPTGVAHLKLTSATTSHARLVAFTGPQLAADAAHIVSTMGLRPDWPNLGAISLAHSYGFSNLVLPLLLQGIPLFLLEAPLPESVRNAVRQIGNVTLPGVPALWRAWHEAGIITSSIRLAISGVKIHNFYGSTECGGIAYDRASMPRDDESCVGGAMDGVALTIGATGCLEVRSDATGLSYWPHAESELSDGVFQTSDLAELKNGLVYLRGRAGDLMNIAGRKVAPDTIERALRASDAVADCLVFGVPGGDVGRGDLIVACVVARQPVAEGELKQFLLSRLPAWQVPKEWRFVETLQPNERGKLSRAQWRERLGYSR